MLELDEDFVGCVVHSRAMPYLDGRVVTKTVKKLKCKNRNAFLYEVELDGAKKHYYLYKEEMRGQK